MLSQFLSDLNFLAEFNLSHTTQPWKEFYRNSTVKQFLHHSLFLGKWIINTEIITVNTIRTIKMLYTIAPLILPYPPLFQQKFSDHPPLPAKPTPFPSILEKLNPRYKIRKNKVISSNHRWWTLKLLEIQECIPLC